MKKTIIQIRNVIFVTIFVASFAIMEMIMIDDSNAIRPIRERAAMRVGRSVDKEEDIESLRKRAEEGDADAQFSLGLMYSTWNLGVPPQNYAEAMKWYRLAAEQGHANAHNNLGCMYACGQGVPQDDAEAAKWFHRAAERGCLTALKTLGEMYAAGAGVPKSWWEAYIWTKLTTRCYHARIHVSEVFDLTEEEAGACLAADDNLDECVKHLSPAELASVDAEIERRYTEIRRKTQC